MAQSAARTMSQIIHQIRMLQSLLNTLDLVSEIFLALLVVVAIAGWGVFMIALIIGALYG